MHLSIVTLFKSSSTTYEAYLDIVKHTKDKLVVIDVGTQKSDAWQYLNPGIEDSARIFADQVVVLRIDYMVVPEIMWEWKFHQVPTVLIVKEGKIIDQFVSTLEGEVNDRIRKALAGQKVKPSTNVL